VLWLVVALAQQVPGGIPQILDLARETGRLHIFDGGFNLYAMGAYSVAFSYFFQLMQDYGTDQTTVQRMMAISERRGVTKAIFFNAAVDVIIVAALLFIGLGLFAYHAAFPAYLPDGLSNDQILPYYVIHALPDGVSGLLITALFAAAMSSMDSGISCVSTVILHDFVRPLRGGTPDEARDLRLARILTAVLGAGATALAFYVASFGHLIKAYTGIISLFSAPILALFLLGLLTRRARFVHWWPAAALGIAANWWVQNHTEVHWIYYFPLSLAVTFGGAWIASRFARPSAKRL